MIAKIKDCKVGTGYTEDNREVSVFKSYDIDSDENVYGIFIDTADVIYNPDLEIVAGDALPRDFK